jgi:hypothetical protein
VKEKKGPDGQGLDTPDAIVGLDLVNPSTEVTRLQQIIESNIDPKIPGIQVQDLPYKFEKRPVIIVRIPPSWVSPHIVTFKEDFRFYLRIGRKKVRMDLDHIRAAILGEGAQITAARRFRQDRLGKLLAGEAPVKLHSTVTAILHIVPLSRRMGNVLKIESLHRKERDFPPLTTKEMDDLSRRINFDGILVWHRTKDLDPPDTDIGYVQLFRNGSIESVDIYMIASDGDRKAIWAKEFEKTIVNGLRNYMKFLIEHSVDLPIFVGLSLLGVQGYRVFPEGSSRHYLNQYIERDHLIFPEIIVESYDHPPELILKETFDMLWQSSGLLRSQHYDAEGRWLLSGK